MRVPVVGLGINRGRIRCIVNPRNDSPSLRQNRADAKLTDVL